MCVALIDSTSEHGARLLTLTFMKVILIQDHILLACCGYRILRAELRSTADFQMEVLFIHSFIYSFLVTLKQTQAGPKPSNSSLQPYLKCWFWPLWPSMSPNTHYTCSAHLDSRVVFSGLTVCLFFLFFFWWFALLSPRRISKRANKSAPWRNRAAARM